MKGYREMFKGSEVNWVIVNENGQVLGGFIEREPAEKSCEVNNQYGRIETAGKLHVEPVDGFESYKITYNGSHVPHRRETLKGAENLVERLRKNRKHGEVEGVWFDDNGIRFELIKKF